MDASTVVADVMNTWRAGIDAGDPGRVAAAFTADAVFQGLRPYGVGRDAVRAYYAAQRAGMTVGYDILESRRLAEGVVTGYLRATFAYRDRDAVTVHIGVVLVRGADGWAVAQYQAADVR